MDRVQYIKYKSTLPVGDTKANTNAMFDYFRYVIQYHIRSIMTMIVLM